MVMRNFLMPLLLSVSIFGTSSVKACDLAIVFAVDVSGSVDPQEFRIQMDGLAAALRDSAVAEALWRKNAQVTLIQWTGSSRQRQTLPWTSMADFSAVEAFADAIEANPRVWRNFSTALGEALQVSQDSFAQVTDCARFVVDVSGDGRSNEGISPQDRHSDLRQAGITVNGLAIETDDSDLTAYFFENVITGEGAFVETAWGFENYPAAILRKLQRETTRAAAQKTHYDAIRRADLHICDHAFPACDHKR